MKEFYGCVKKIFHPLIAIFPRDDLGHWEEKSEDYIQHVLHSQSVLLGGLEKIMRGIHPYTAVRLVGLSGVVLVLNSLRIYFGNVWLIG